MLPAAGLHRQVVGGPNARTDFHVDPVRGVLLPGQGQHARQPDRRRRAAHGAHPRGRDVAACPRNTPHSPQRPEAGSVGLVIERRPRGGHAGEVPVVLPEVQRPGARGRASGPRHRRRPAPGVRRVLRRREGTHLHELRHAAPGQGLRRRYASSTSTRTTCRRAGRTSARRREAAPMRLAAHGLRARMAVIMVGATEFRRIGANCWDAAVRLADMDADGVDVQVVSPTPVFFSYGRPAVAGGPGREDLQRPRAGGLRGRRRAAACRFCQVPLQDPDLRPAPSWTAAWPPATRGARSATTSATATSTTPASCTFLARTARLVGAPVFVHPWDMTGRAAAGPVDGPLAGRHARRDAPVGRSR